MIFNQQLPAAGGGGSPAAHTVTCGYSNYGTVYTFDKDTLTWTTADKTATEGELVLVRLSYTAGQSSLTPLPYAAYYIPNPDGSGVSGGNAVESTLGYERRSNYYTKIYFAFVMPAGYVEISDVSGSSSGGSND